MEQTVNIRGSSVNSRDNVQAQEEKAFSSTTFYEAQITSLFIPWLIAEIPDEKWQTLQAKLCQTVRDIVSGKRSKQDGVSPA